MTATAPAIPTTTTTPANPAALEGLGQSRFRRLVRGHPEDPRWVRPALVALLGATAVLYLWTLSDSGWANSFYTAAAQAGSVSWKAFFFGSFDSANAITVDKPPGALWPQALSIRLFGLSSWSVLVPEALMGVASVGVLYAAVRRWFTPAAGMLAGAALALTPVAALMFRFNNPDALLTLLMTVAAYSALRAVDDGRARWFIATGALIGFGFLTKQLQVLLVVPGFAAAHLFFGPSRLLRRFGDLAIAGAAMVAAAGWWVAIVELWPADSRPYIGGSPTNSIIELTLGYNGIGRLTGEEIGSVGGGGPQGGPMWGQTGITRLLDNEIGGQIAWLLPAAIACLLVGLWITRRAPRRDMQRASLAVWGSWLLVTALTFSYMSGIFHAYYTIALAPAIGALVGIGVSLLWARRNQPAACLSLATLSVGTALWSRQLLQRAPIWQPWLADLVLVAGVVAAVGVFAAGLLANASRHPLSRPIAVVAGVVGILAALAAPAGWTLQTVSEGHQGAIVTAGPAVAGGGFGPGGGGFRAGGFPGGGGFPAGGFPAAGGGAGFPGGGLPSGGFPAGGLPGGGSFGSPPSGGGGPGGLGGLLNGPAVSDELATTLLNDADHYTWVAATTGSQNASSYQLATERPVMSIGGFNGSDPSPTLDEFKAHVANGEIHYYIESGLSGIGSFGGSDVAREIQTWVADNYGSMSIGGATLYDLGS